MATLLFQVRGTQLDAYVTQSIKTWAQDAANGQVPSVVADASAGVFGGSKLDVRSLSGPKALQYVGLDNLPYGSGAAGGAFTLLIRVIPTYTGNPPTVQTYGMAGPSAGATANQGFWFRHNTNGTLNFSYRSTSQSAHIDLNTTATLALVSGQATDIWVTWDGTNTAGSVKFYYAHNGNAPTLLEAANPSSVFGTRQRYASNPIIIGTGVFGSSNYYLNEFALWSGVFDLVALGARTSFISATAFEGMSYSDPGVANVRSGTAYTYAGSSQTGTLTVPSLANTKTGVAGDGGTGTYDGSDRWTALDESVVARGQEYKSNSTTNNKTGTLDNVTNEVSEATLQGQNDSAILVETQ